MSRLNGILFNSCNVFACHAARLVLSEIRLFTVRSAKHMTIAFAGWQIFKWQSLLLQGTAGRAAQQPKYSHKSFVHNVLHDTEAFRWQSRDTPIADQSFP